MMRALITKTLFVLSILLSTQAFAFDVGGLSYYVINATDVEVTGRASGNTDTNIVIPATVGSGTTYSVTTIGERAFFLSGLTSVIIPDSVTTIGDFAFYGNNLTSVIIPDSVTTIGDFAFYGNNLTSVVIPDSVTTIEVAAFADNALTSVTIGNSVTTIGNGAFINNALTSVVIGNSVTTIGNGAFNNNALTSVVIPNSVTTIGNGAFSNNALTSAVFQGNFGGFQLDIFGSNPALATITYCGGTVGWPQGFSTGSTFIVTERVSCSTEPTIDSIAVGNGQAVITFTPGVDNGSPITSNTATCTDGSADYTGTSPTSPITVSGLTNGVSYVCVVSAINDEGTSSNSELSAPFTPVAPPSAPQITSIEPGNAQVFISVSVADDGGSPITGYNAYCFGDTFYFGVNPTSPITVSGLTNGVSYVCVVSAENDIGTSTLSAVSAPFTPVAPPPGC